VILSGWRDLPEDELLNSVDLPPAGRRRNRRQAA